MLGAVPILVLLLLFASCTHDANPAGSPDAVADAVADVPSDAGSQRLTFVDEQGDDQRSCVDVDVCTYHVSYQSERTLRVRYTVDGAPVAGVEIAFEVVDDVQGQGQLAAASAWTDESGLADASIRIIRQGPGCGHYFKVKASVVGSPALAPLFFVITALAKCDAYLTVSFVYDGSKLFDGVTVYLYKSSSPGAADLACADLDDLELPSADLQKGPHQLSQTARFSLLPGLEDEKEQFYTIVARGELVDGTRLAWGCDDAEGHVLLSSSKHVTIQLKDLPPRLVGTYDLQTRMDLLGALPDNEQVVVNFLLNFIAKPSTSLLLLACELSDATLHDFCGWVFADPDAPDQNQLTALGTVVLEIMDSFLSAAVEPWTGTEIFGLGGDGGDLLEELTVLATFDLACEPDENGFIPESCASAAWHAVSTRWTYGLSCPPNDDECGRLHVDLQAMGHDVAPSPFAATLLHTGDYSELTLGEQRLLLRYGQLFDHLLQKVVLPRVFGDGSDGLPVVDGYEKLFLSLLAGGKACLQPTRDQPGCCQVFAQSVVAKTDAVGSAALEQACDALVPSASAYLAELLVGLDPTSGATFKLQTRDGQPCKLYDLNADRKIDAWGKKEPLSERCIWDLDVNVFGAFVDIDKNNFYGSEHQ